MLDILSRDTAFRGKCPRKPFQTATFRYLSLTSSRRRINRRERLLPTAFLGTATVVELLTRKVKTGDQAQLTFEIRWIRWSLRRPHDNSSSLSRFVIDETTTPRGTGVKDTLQFVPHSCLQANVSRKDDNRKATAP